MKSSFIFLSYARISFSARRTNPTTVKPVQNSFRTVFMAPPSTAETGSILLWNEIEFHCLNMLEAFAVTLREGTEAALILCLLLTYLKRANRPDLQTTVFTGLAAAVACSLVFALVLRSTGIDPENETVEGTLLTLSAFLVGGLVLWMHRHGRQWKKMIEDRAESILRRRGGQTLGLFLLTFFLVAREGVEMVLLWIAAGLTTESVLSSLGGIAGIGLAAGLGIALYRGTLQVDLRRFFAVTTVVLLVFAVQLLGNGIHEFMEAGVLPSSPEVMKIAGPMARYGVLFTVTVLLVASILLFQRTTVPETSPENPAEERARRAAERGARNARMLYAALGAMALALLGYHFFLTRQGLELSPAEPLSPEGPQVRIALAPLQPKTLHRFAVPLSGRSVRILAYRTDDGRILTSFDACDNCRDSGYVQQGEHILCLNCLAEIDPATLGTGGGCNPIPLPSRADGDTAVIALADLEKRAEIFETRTDLVQCPRCRMWFAPADGGPTIDVDGRQIQVCRMKECAQ